MKRLALIAALILAAIIVSGPAFALTNGVSVDHSKGIILVGSGTANCNAANIGGIRYNSTTPNIEFCDGTVWRMLAASSVACGSPSGLSFTNLTGQPTSTIVGSDIATITFSGCAGSSLFVSVTGAPTAQISINGGGWTTSGSILSGQTLQVRMTTSPSASTTLTATVTVNATSVNWTTTTIGGSLKMFLTANYYSPNFGGLAGADAICQSEASTAGYSGTYKAILSDDTTSAASRLTLSYPIVNAYDGSTVASANFWNVAHAGAIDAPGGGHGNQIWSGSNVDGSSNVGQTCSNWTTASGSYNGDCGSPSLAGYGGYNATWLDKCNYSGTQGCNGGSVGLYCIQQDLASCTSIGGLSFSNLTSQPLSSSVQSGLSTITFSGCSGGSSLTAAVIGEPSAEISINGGAWTTSGAITSGQTLRVRMTTSGSVSTTRTATVQVGSASTNWTTTTTAGALKVFMTTSTYLGTGLGGLSGADAICQGQANAAGYAGTYKAILSDESTNAKDRLTLSYPIVNAYNGTTVAAANLWVGSINSLPTQPSGSHPLTPTWSGTNADGTKTAGNTCSSWTGGTNGYTGQWSVDATWIHSSAQSCGNNYYLYCIQQ